MLSRIDLGHFKCFERLRLPLCPLTLLAGRNASGKSSVMQSLLLLHQTMREHEWSSRLVLNGAAVQLGTAVEIIDEDHGRHRCAIVLIDGDADHFEWEFEGERDQMSMAIRRARGDTTEHGSWEWDGTEALRYLLPPDVSGHSLTDRLCRLTYLSAERLGPRGTYPYDDPQLTPVVGPRGEFAVSILHSGRDQKILPELVMEGVPPTRFRQTEAYLGTFFPDCVLDLEQVRRANAVTLGIRVSNGGRFHRPSHTGFGITQVLPIVIAALTAGKQDILVIENPEIHLHPAGQASMGAFLGKVASAGVQVILETHSDHVLNGIRRAVKSGLLPSEDAAIHFFRPRGEQPEEEPQVESPAIDRHGNIDSWPSGFFDQFDEDMNHFAGWD